MDLFLAICQAIGLALAALVACGAGRTHTAPVGAWSYADLDRTDGSSRCVGGVNSSTSRAV